MLLALFLVESIGAPRNHHALFVRSNGNDGHLFQVTGNIQEGMTYESKATEAPELSASYYGMHQIGWVSSSDLEQLDEICRSNPPPPKQFDGPRHINPKKPLRRCQEWTAETIKMMREGGALRSVSNGISGSSPKSSDAKLSPSK